MFDFVIVLFFFSISVSSLLHLDIILSGWLGLEHQVTYPHSLCFWGIHRASFIAKPTSFAPFAKKVELLHETQFKAIVGVIVS